jgi:hypothetical protein
MRAYSLTDGHLIWTSKPFASTEYANNAVPYCYAGVVMEGGLIYGYAGYSTLYQIDPLPRFNMLVCINATTGDTVFALNGGIDTSAAANGYVFGSSINDGNLYCVGKGQTSTSVVIQNDVVANGATVLIKGNVLDQSPAQPGTPAVSDANMSEQMDYLHMQNSTLLNNPPQETGVPVTLTAVDPNGNFITIGSTTTDSAGNYAVNFVPSAVGIYTIKATFAGTNSYWPSNSETSLSVTSPDAKATPTPVKEETDNTSMFIGSTLAIIIAIAIVGLLMLRKHP